MARSKPLRMKQMLIGRVLNVGGAAGHEQGLRRQGLQRCPGWVARAVTALTLELSAVTLTGRSCLP